MSYSEIIEAIKALTLVVATNAEFGISTETTETASEKIRELIKAINLD